MNMLWGGGGGGVDGSNWKFIKTHILTEKLPKRLFSSLKNPNFQAVGCMFQELTSCQYFASFVGGWQMTLSYDLHLQSVFSLRKPKVFVSQIL